MKSPDRIGKAVEKEIARNNIQEELRGKGVSEEASDYKVQWFAEARKQVEKYITKQHDTPLDLDHVFTAQEKEEITQKRASRYLERGWYEDMEQAYQRASMEMMPADKYQKYVRIAKIISRNYNTELTRENVTFSTNRKGQHSWYICVFNPDFVEEIGSETTQANHHETSEEAYLHAQRIVAIKITDHETNWLQTETKSGILVYETIIVSEDDDTIEIINTIENEIHGVDFDDYKTTHMSSIQDLEEGRESYSDEDE